MRLVLDDDAGFCIGAGGVILSTRFAYVGQMKILGRFWTSRGQYLSLRVKVRLKVAPHFDGDKAGTFESSTPNAFLLIELYLLSFNYTRVSRPARAEKLQNSYPTGF